MIGDSSTEPRVRPRRLRVLFVTTAIDRAGAGMFEAVSGLARRLADLPRTEVTLISAAPRPLEPAEVHAWGGVRIVAERARSRASGFLAMHRSLNRIKSDDYDIVHAHGIWGGPSVTAAAWAQTHGKPYVLSPHGMLEPWSMRYHRLKKALPWLLWERGAIGSATVIETKSQLEARNVRSLGFANPLAVIPIALDDDETLITRRDDSGTRTCLFLSRIHPKKGVELLIEAWKALRPQGWRLIIAGPDGGGYQRSLEAVAASAGLAGEIVFPGPAYGSEKRRLIQAAAVFCLPSYSENFGIVVIEALSQGVPVITTTATPWEELVARKCGWQVEPNVAGIQSALKDALSLAPDQLQRMGDNGRHYVDECFRWDVIVRDTLNLYAWACGDGPPPQTLVGSLRPDALRR